MIDSGARRAVIVGAVYPSFTVTALGARVRVVIEDGAVTAAEYDDLLDLWERCGSRGPDDAIVDATVRRTIRPAHDDPRSPADEFAGSMSTSFRALTDRLSSEVTGAAIHSVRGRLLMLHAAALADPATGRVLAFVGPSGMGKTTVSRALGRRLHYLSDETTGISIDLTVEPYPKPLSLRVVPDGRPKRQVAPVTLGLLAAEARSYRLHRIVVLDRRDDAPRHPHLEPLSVTEAIAAVTAEVSHLRALKRPMQRLAEACSAGGGAVRVSYREVDDLATVLAELFAERGPAPAWRTVDASVATNAVPLAESVVRRHPVTDAVADDLGVAIFHDGVVRVLAGIGPAMWAAARQWSTVEQLTAAVVAEFGRPDGASADAIVGAAVDELVASGLLERTAE